jgi:hypothetical protein
LNGIHVGSPLSSTRHLDGEIDPVTGYGVSAVSIPRHSYRFAAFASDGAFAINAQPLETDMKKLAAPTMYGVSARE